MFGTVVGTVPTGAIFGISVAILKAESSNSVSELLILLGCMSTHMSPRATYPGKFIMALSTTVAKNIVKQTSSDVQVNC